MKNRTKETPLIRGSFNIEDITNYIDLTRMYVKLKKLNLTYNKKRR
jgi:hypothetical protein